MCQVCQCVRHTFQPPVSDYKYTIRNTFAFSRVHTRKVPFNFFCPIFFQRCLPSTFQRKSSLFPLSTRCILHELAVFHCEDKSSSLPRDNLFSRFIITPNKATGEMLTKNRIRCLQTNDMPWLACSRPVEQIGRMFCISSTSLKKRKIGSIFASIPL